jgi:hypothetical protein
VTGRHVFNGQFQPFRALTGGTCSRPVFLSGVLISSLRPLCVLCASAVSLKAFTAEAQRTQRGRRELNANEGTTFFCEVLEKKP